MTERRNTVVWKRVEFVCALTWIFHDPFGDVAAQGHASGRIDGIVHREPSRFIGEHREAVRAAERRADDAEDRLSWVDREVRLRRRGIAEPLDPREVGPRGHLTALDGDDRIRARLENVRRSMVAVEADPDGAHIRAVLKAGAGPGRAGRRYVRNGPLTRHGNQRLRSWAAYVGTTPIGRFLYSCPMLCVALV